MADKITFQAPENSGGFAVGNETYAPDAKGRVSVFVHHVADALAHGFKALGALPSEQDASAPIDPNVNRAGGDTQHPVKPGDTPAPKIELAGEEAELALANAAAAKGGLLDDDEKAAVLAAALEVKATAGIAADADAAPTKAKK